MNNTASKKKGRLAGRPQQSPPTKAEIVTAEGIPLSAKHKKILAQVRRFLSDALDASDEIENNVARGELQFFAENTVLLRRSFCGCRHLCRGVASIAQQAKRQEVRS